MLTYKQWLFEAFTSPDSKLATKIKVKHGTLIVPRTYDACKKYGMGTKWCITYKNDDHYWNDYIGNQKLTPYFFIPDEEWVKKLSNSFDLDGYDFSKVAIMIRDDGEWRHIWDAKDENISDIEFFPIGKTDTSSIVSTEFILKLGGVDVSKLTPMEIESNTETFTITNKQYLDTINDYIKTNYNKETKEQKIIKQELSKEFFHELLLKMIPEVDEAENVTEVFYKYKDEIEKYIASSPEVKRYNEEEDENVGFDIMVEYRSILRILLGKTKKTTTVIKEK